MEVPLKVVVTLFLTQSTVLTIMAFKPGKITFQSIGCSWDLRFIKVMEHIWQSSQKHASSAFDIAEDVTGLRPTANLGTILSFPLTEVLKKLVPIFLAIDSGDLKKDFSKLLGICGFGRGPAPTQPLPLDVDEASLDWHARPQFPEGLYYVGVAINGKTARMQSGPYKTVKEGRKLGFRVLRDRILTGHNFAVVGIPQGKKGARAVKESPVHDAVLALTQAKRGLRMCLFQIVINHTIEFCRAMPALAGQLSDRITFNNPAFEPLPFSGVPCRGIAPAKRAEARFAEPPLLAVCIMAISLNNARAVRTVFFCS